MRMELLQVVCKTSIPKQSASNYKGIAFDGYYFYLTCPDLCKIIKYDTSFCEVECFNTMRPYTCICYDAKENCFWVSNNKCYDKIFKLNAYLYEINCISIRTYQCRGGIVTGISYNCNENSLLVSFANCIVSICKTDAQNEKTIQKSSCMWNMGICSVSPSYIAIEMKDAKQYITVYDCSFTIQFQYAMPHGYVAQSIILNPLQPDCGEKLHFSILATKSGSYSCIMECTLGICGSKIYDCNYCVCEKECCTPPCATEPQTCNDLIESIALIEMALSHILNAEGEKLQKIIASTDDIEEILCANQAINETIVKITHLEIILHDKLATVKNLSLICNHNQKCCDKE